MLVPTLRVLLVLIVPTLRVGMHTVTLCVTVDAERPWRHSHADGSTPRRGNDQRCRAWERAAGSVGVSGSRGSVRGCR
ncbi:hypothetical protein C1891_19500 [Pseudomonas sp. GW456-12-1-14-TSB6]|nr:hypothetical protein C1891_19500 [Pseudomonas sp. GW456-12-1-14-TSB6]